MIPNLTQVWTFLNSPVVILLLGSGIGFLFVKLVWEPLKAQRAARDERKSFQHEAKFRLLNIRLKLSDPAWKYEYEVSGSAPGSGTYLTSYIDPTYQSWGLHGLIYAGWSPELFEKCYPIVDRLIKAESATAARNALAELQKVIDGDQTSN